MRRKTEVSACPCGSGLRYAACCGPCHDGSVPAASAEALTRSRYSAYVLKRAAYLLDSWHPDTRPASVEGLDEPKWLRLEVLACEAGGPGDPRGRVHFRAWYTRQGRACCIEEFSRFERVAGRWLYRDGGPPV